MLLKLRLLEVTTPPPPPHYTHALNFDPLCNPTHQHFHKAKKNPHRSIKDETIHNIGVHSTASCNTNLALLHIHSNFIFHTCPHFINCLSCILHHFDSRFTIAVNPIKLYCDKNCIRISGEIDPFWQHL